MTTKNSKSTKQTASEATTTNATNDSTMKQKMQAAIAAKAAPKASESKAEAPKAAEAAAPAKKSEPFGGKKAEPFKTLGERDKYGFGQDTETSWLLHQLEAGKQTKQQLLDAFLAKFVPDGNAADQKRKKTSFSVFFSDVKKPFGTYHASRSIEIIADADSGVLSLEPKSAERARKAIAAGILNKLRGFTPNKHHEKINVVLKEFALPLLADKK